MGKYDYKKLKKFTNLALDHIILQGDDDRGDFYHLVYKEGQSIEEAITADIPNFSFNIRNDDLNVRFVWERDERTNFGYYFILREIKVAKGSQIPTSIRSNLFDIDWLVIKRIIKNKEY